MSLFVLDLAQLYRVTFGGEPANIVNDNRIGYESSKYTKDASNSLGLVTAQDSLGNTLSKRIKSASGMRSQMDIWLPTKFVNLNQKNLAFPNGAIPFSFNELLLPYTTVQISGNKSYIETPLIGRTGSVKEFYNQDDYEITIRGFLIDDQNLRWPETQLRDLATLFAIGQSVGINNALLNYFLLDLGQQVIIKKFTLPEVVGGKTHVRPFELQCASDSVFDLIVK